MNLAGVGCIAVAGSAVGMTLPLGTAAVAVGIPGRNFHIGLRDSVPAIVASNPDPVAVADSCTDPLVDWGTV